MNQEIFNYSYRTLLPCVNECLESYLHNIRIQTYPVNSWNQIPLSNTEIYVYSAFWDPYFIIIDNQNQAKKFKGVKIVTLTRTEPASAIWESQHLMLYKFLYLALIKIQEFCIKCFAIFSRHFASYIPNIYCHVVFNTEFFGIQQAFVKAIKKELPEHHSKIYASTIYYCPLKDGISNLFSKNSNLISKILQNQSSNTLKYKSYDNGWLLSSFPLGVTLIEGLSHGFAANQLYPFEFENIVVGNVDLKFVRITVPNSEYLIENKTGSQFNENIFSSNSSAFPDNHFNYSPLHLMSLSATKSGGELPSLNSPLRINVCVPPLFDYFDDAKFIINFLQMMEWNKLNGVQQTFLYRIPSYANNSYYSEINPAHALFSHYQDRAQINLRSWILPTHLRSPEAVHYNAQVANVNDCLFRNGNDLTDAILFQDFDELLFYGGDLPPKNSSFFFRFKRDTALIEGSDWPRSHLAVETDELYYHYNDDKETTNEGISNIAESLTSSDHDNRLKLTRAHFRSKASINSEERVSKMNRQDRLYPHLAIRAGFVSFAQGLTHLLRHNGNRELCGIIFRSLYMGKAVNKSNIREEGASKQQCDCGSKKGLYTDNNKNLSSLSAFGPLGDLSNIDEDVFKPRDPNDNKLLNSCSGNPFNFEIPLISHKLALSDFYPSSIRSKFLIFPLASIETVGIHAPHQTRISNGRTISNHDILTPDPYSFHLRHFSVPSVSADLSAPTHPYMIYDFDINNAIKEGTLCGCRCPSSNQTTEAGSSNRDDGESENYLKSNMSLIIGIRQCALAREYILKRNMLATLNDAFYRLKTSENSSRKILQDLC
ncbi:unnamed protein product [Gordionus sp. m RMFG-2023]|uniref:uncharacterized protein LOC135924540 n=1 Tax=Gordionus sp. m RMFG-2023 TaxID=3053472 RepID=UPI0030DED9B6